MSTHRTILLGETPATQRPRTAAGSYTEISGERFYRIAGHDAMPPFLMSLVSDSDHWLFLSSNGGLTAGRRDPDHALFPYYPDDRIHDAAGETGSKTIVLATRDGATHLWEPFSSRGEGFYRITRNLYKSVWGNKVIFEEINADLALAFCYSWTTSERFGFVRRARLENRGAGPVSIEILDGIQNLLPHGIGRRYQLEYSTLADGYKRSELEPETGLGLFRMSSIPTDKAEPSEALRVTTVWCEGLEPASRLLSATQLDAFRQGRPVEPETDIRGKRGAYFLASEFRIEPGAHKEWTILADVDRDSAAVAALLVFLKETKDLRIAVDEDVERGTFNLTRMVAAADGLQCTADELSIWRHYSNVLFNAMRGGIPDSGYTISRADFLAFLQQAGPAVFAHHRAFLDSLPENLAHAVLLTQVRVQDDPDLERLAFEYLPLTFSRRHGDPSRPWNIFAIEVKDAHGNKILNYQGNWRDIFQNWEALALSYPGYLESMIFKFVDASTADGYNPYRVTREGFDWEVPDPHDPWSNLGYWGDHQVIYLLKLLEASARYSPGAVASLLGRRVFSYANVPYRIKPYENLLHDPRNTVEFDAALHRQIAERVSTLGASGRSILDADHAPHRANLTEKLLVVVLAKLFNYIPEAGIWMNTQRPEWNDANNALVGYGVSMVTLYYLRRFLAFFRDLFQPASAFEISAEVAIAFRAVTAALDRALPQLSGPLSDRARKAVLDELGAIGSDYRAGIYASGFSGEQTALTAAEIAAFCDLALRHIDHSIRANRRPDGLYHSYNLMKVAGEDIVVRRLSEMLEGQVAVLSSGALTAEESVALLDALRASPLYRADQDSYILYPDRPLPHFLEKNNIPAEAIERSPLLLDMLARNDRRIVVRDVNGVVHFNAALRNAVLLDAALEGLAEPAERARILDLYEEVFDHQSFTGRSGTFYKYEGLGCIYWHMVSKLALIVQEVWDQAVRAGASAATVDALRAHYHAIREGIGVHKPPQLYGAVPTDPYSHTPGFAGVQQPGMTGQVKEDLLARFGELGAAVEKGCLVFRPHLLHSAEFLGAPAVFRFLDLEGRLQVIDLERDTLAFTTCQVPVVAHRGIPPRIEITRSTGAVESIDGLALDPASSRAIFERTGEVRRVDVFFGV